MSDWVEDDEPGPSREAQWLHVPTGVELFVRRNGEGYAVCLQATEASRVDTVSIGDPETGQFRAFDEAGAAVAWADEWKDQAGDLEALLPPEE
jgi:hypothetical protein